MRKVIILMALLGITAVFQTTRAQTGGGYDLSWSTVDGGGGQSSDAVYEVIGTVGQMDAGNASGGGYEWSGGFWQEQVISPTAVALHNLFASPSAPTWLIPVWLLAAGSLLVLGRWLDQKRWG